MAATAPTYDELWQHPPWMVETVFDPDELGGDFAYTVGLHRLGFPELHLWARPDIGEDPGLDWILSLHDRAHLLNDFGARLVTGKISVGSEFMQRFDNGEVFCRFIVGPPGDRDHLEALGIDADAEVLPISWSLHR
jgi:hypothetical protein